MHILFLFAFAEFLCLCALFVNVASVIKACKTKVQLPISILEHRHDLLWKPLWFST